MCVCKLVCIFTNLFLAINLYICTFTHANAYTHTRTCTHSFTHTHSLTHTFKYTYKHTHWHREIYRYKGWRKLSLSDRDILMKCDQIKFNFHHSYSYSPQTSFIGVTMPGFHWSKKSYELFNPSQFVVSLYLWVFLALFVSISAFLTLSLYIYLSHSLSLTLSLSIYIYIYICIYINTKFSNATTSVLSGLNCWKYGAEKRFVG